MTEKDDVIPIGLFYPVKFTVTYIAIRSQKTVKFGYHIVIDRQEVAGMCNFAVTPLGWMKVFRVTEEIGWQNIPAYIGSQPAITDLAVGISCQK